MICDSDHYIEELKQKFPNQTFQRVNQVDGKYITNVVNKSTANDIPIFKETQAKKVLRSWSSPLVRRDIKNKLQYFSQGEDNNESVIYQRDEVVQSLQSAENAIQNIGHATQLIQIPKFNVLTDPVFNDLDKHFYPEITKSHPDVHNLPKIDVIIISHNHRDHLDETSLALIVDHHKLNDWPQPTLFVPMGDKSLFQSIGFSQIEEVEWFTKISVTKETKTLHFISIPSDHRSGRGLTDHHRSLVTGWIINAEHENVIIKFSGDTRPLTDVSQQATDCVLWNEIKLKQINQGKSNEDIQIPRIILIEPSGPNYTRRDMDITHQSTSYSILLKFIEALNLSNLSGRSDFLSKMKTIMIHHNKYELGPDRFNEGLFVFKKLLNYLDLNEDELEIELLRQKQKLEEGSDRKKLRASLPFTSRPLLSTLPATTSLLVHAKDFIIEEIKLVTSKVSAFDKGQIKEYAISGTVFPKIGERVTDAKLDNFRFDVESVNKYCKKRNI